MQAEPFVKCNNLVKIYLVSHLEVVALQGLDLDVTKGEMMALVGASGSGKSTLLNIIGGLDSPNAGNIHVGNDDLLSMDNRHRELYKREVVGFLWQQPGRNLLPYLSAVENVELPMMLGNKLSTKVKRKRALKLLEILGLSDHCHSRPNQLSGGEQQRVALAVALANNPPLLLADEPTGQLDSKGASQVFHALRQLNQAFNTTIIIVTHDPQVAARVDRVIGIRDGKTSTEIQRMRNQKDGSLQEDEWVILDKTGRLQLPQVYVDELLMQGRVKVRLEEDHVTVWPDKDNSSLSTNDVIPRHQWRPDAQINLSKNFVLQYLHEGAENAVTTYGLWRTFKSGKEEIHAVQNINLVIPRGVMAVIKGRSGSGKTTLLNLIGGLDKPSRGTIVVEGEILDKMSSKEKIEFLRRKVGFVFQSFGLMPFLSARENVEAPLRLVNTPSKERQTRTNEALNLVGLIDRAEHRVHELSGGEQQRVAIARALVSQPSLILADEPTGQLDTITGSNIISLLREIAHKTGITIIIASHDPKVEEAVDFVYDLMDGKLISISV
ncbi:MAG: ABC transporter ATP-binding protein [Candidatus Hermodarchaeia archaeon]|jgi:ABC-type lipoprotein export system ATPase subunit